MWHRHFKSHKQVEAVFNAAPPPLQGVSVCELLFKAGEQVYFSADVSVQPDELPAKLVVAGAIAIQFRFSLNIIDAPSLHGMPITSSACDVAFEDRGFSIRAIDGSWSISAQAILDSVEVVSYVPQEAGHGVDWFSVNHAAS
jgi:hypothetical protein